MVSRLFLRSSTATGCHLQTVRNSLHVDLRRVFMKSRSYCLLFPQEGNDKQILHQVKLDLPNFVKQKLDCLQVQIYSDS